MGSSGFDWTSVSDIFVRAMASSDSITSQSRQRGLLPPSLTLSRFGAPPDPTSTPTLAHILSHLHPLIAHLPLTLDYLNTTPFSPHSEAEDLHAGVLQLPAGSTVLITEDGVREGKLLERGVRNVMAAQEAINAQTLAYQFPFSDFSFPVDFSFVVVSEGSKSAFLKVYQFRQLTRIEY